MNVKVFSPHGTLQTPLVFEAGPRRSSLAEEVQLALQRPAASPLSASPATSDSDGESQESESQRLARILVRAAVAKTVGFQEKLLVTDKAVGQLGFAPTCWPPGRVAVGRLEKGGWAASQGLALGDQLRRVNGRHVSKFGGREDLSAALKERPLRLALLRPPPGVPEAVSSAAAAAPEAAAEEATARSAKRAAARVAAAKVALRDVVTLAAGAAPLLRQELEHPDGEGDGGQVALDALGAFEALQGRLAAGGGDRKGGLCELLGGRKWLAFTVHADVGVDHFGFSITASCMVRAEEPGGWAAAHGVQLGDVLLLLDEDLAYGMDKGVLIKTIRDRRPMKLTFLRPGAPTGASPQLANVYSAAALMAKVVNSWAEEDDSDNASDTEFVPLSTEQQGFFARAFGGLFASSSARKPGEATPSSRLWSRAFRRGKPAT